MGNLPLSLRKELDDRFSVRPVLTKKQYVSADGTIKLALQFSDGAGIEAVLLAGSSTPKKAPDKYTACLSTQAGCPAGCVFCRTGSLGFLRNLSSAEIVEQFFQLKKAAEEASGLSENNFTRTITNIVFMGMGEPLLNLEELRKAINVITSPQGLHFSKKRITVSTCGMTDGIISLADNGPQIRLALSLPSADERLRRRLMPITGSQSLAGVKKALDYFQKKGGGRVTLETVLLGGGLNTALENAAGIAEFAGGLNVAVNLIPWNPVKGLVFDGIPLSEPSVTEIKEFKKHLESMGLVVTCRFRRGRGVMGACGQLGELPAH